MRGGLGMRGGWAPAVRCPLGGTSADLMMLGAQAYEAQVGGTEVVAVGGAPALRLAGAAQAAGVVGDGDDMLKSAGGRGHGPLRVGAGTVSASAGGERAGEALAKGDVDVGARGQRELLVGGVSHAGYRSADVQRADM